MRRLKNKGDLLLLCCISFFVCTFILWLVLAIIMPSVRAKSDKASSAHPLTEQVREIMESGKKVKVRDLVFRESYVIDSAGVYIASDYAAVTQQVGLYQYLLGFVEMDYRQRRLAFDAAQKNLEMVKSNILPGENLTRREAAHIEKMTRRVKLMEMYAKRKVTSQDKADLHAKFEQAQLYLEKLESQDAMVYIWDFRLNDSDEWYQISFASPTDTVKLNVIDIKPITQKNE